MTLIYFPEVSTNQAKYKLKSQKYIKIHQKIKYYLCNTSLVFECSYELY